MAAKATKKSGAALEKLRADIKSGSPENVYIFYGEETYLRGAEGPAGAGGL